jgi:predicted nucleic acid-binding protein
VTYLLDTNVISELRRRAPHPNVVTWFEAVRSEELYLSVLTIGEIRRGIQLLRPTDAATADRLDAWLSGLIATYGRRIVAVDTQIAQEWGRLNAPDRVPAIDGLLAATAIVRGWTLVTRNVADVASTGVLTLNPFERPPAETGRD